MLAVVAKVPVEEISTKQSVVDKILTQEHVGIALDTAAVPV
jgi:hypothetical protein